MEAHTIKNTVYTRSLIEASLDPFITISLEGKIVDVNEASIKATGIPRKKLINTNFSDYFTEPQKAQASYLQVFEKGFVIDYPLTIKNKNGNLMDVLYNASVNKDEKGNVIGVFATARNITELKKSSQYARSLIEASIDPFITISLEGKITDVNEASIKVTGIERKKIINTNFSDYFTDPKKAEEGYLQIFEKGFVVDYPLTLRHKKGSLTDVSFNASVYRDHEGNVLGAFAAARDVTVQNWAKDLRKANKELAFQNDEKGKRAEELAIANKELAFQNDEKEKRADELIIANEELAFQNDEKEKRADELVIANKELAFQNDEKEKRAAELVIANEELAFQNEVKEKRAAELVIANAELAFQNDEKEKRAAELVIANEELAFQNDEKEKRSAELIIANEELAFQNNEKEKRAAELVIANGELAYQNEVKEKRAAELVIANEELAFQNIEKEKRAAELVIANEELVFQTKVKEKRAAELVHANEELALQNIEAIKQANANKELVASNIDIKLDSQYSLSLIEASLDPLVTISPAGKITDMNEALTIITGFTREELTDTDFLDYFTEPQKARDVYQEVYANSSVTNSPLTLRHKSGKLIDVLFNGSVYKDDDGSVDGVVIVARDVTEQKRITKELNEAMIFAEMATSIAEEAKIKAEKATKIAENAMKSKQQFLSNMSHEIRTPMNAIIGFTKVVLKTELTAKQKEYLKAIKISGDALIVLINDILDLAKVDAGKMTFEQIPFKMSVSISAMLHLFETKIKEKNLKLVKEYDHKIPNVLVGDPVRLHQIIMNLISNAVKFTSKGKIVMGVKLLSEDDQKVTIEFSVSDTGIGITEDKIDRIFENFQQASSGTSRLYGGTGLGLAIVKQLIETQDGSIQVTSKVNEGSNFIFTLSFLKTTEEAELETELMELDEELINIKILVVEDIALNQLLMKTLLDDFGFECDIAGNGIIAIEKMQTKAYDLILMDLQMPEMNGFEATEHIRNKMKSKVPIIALTADVTTVDLAKCKAVGMDDYIAKPVDEKLLYSKMAGYLKKNQVTEKPKAKELAKPIKIKYTNLNYLKERTKSNQLLMMEMISLYLEQTPPLIGAMKQSFFDKDWKSLHAAVHKMIPSFSIMGIDKDYENMAKKVQEFAYSQKQTDNISEMVMKLEEVCLQACDELKIEFNTIKNNTNE